MAERSTDTRHPTAIVVDEIELRPGDGAMEVPADDEFSTARSLLKFVGTWAGDDLEELLDLVEQTRSEAEF